MWQDVRYGLRMLAKQPGVTLIAVVTLALGIGANTAVFTVVNAALLRGLPYPEPERLVHLWEGTPQKEFPQREASYPDFLDWRRSESFEGVAAYAGGGGMTLTGRGEPERLAAVNASANFFSVLGVKPIMGRDFSPDEERPGGARAVMLSYGLWQRLAGGDPALIGQQLTLNGNGYTVVGVLPADFQFAPRGGAEAWVAFQPSPMQLSRRYMHGTNVIARLKAGVSLEAAAAEMRAVGRRIERDHNESHAGTSIRVVPLQEQIVGQVRPLLLVLLGAVGCVLLISCANVANLLLARAVLRAPEIAVRLALGATRGRLTRQLLTESLLLALLGGGFGVLLAQWGIEALVSAVPEAQLNSMPYLKGLAIDGRMLAFTAGVTLLTGAVFGLAPALAATRRELHEALKAGGRSAAGAGRQRLRQALVVAEVALALVLLVGAGLLLQSFRRLLEVNPGFRTERLLTLRVALPVAKYGSDEKAATIYRQMLERIEALPGVEGVGAVNVLPLSGGNTTRFIVEGEPVPAPGQETEANVREVNPDYFRAMGVPLLRGRAFTARDDPASPRVVIVNQTLAARAFPRGEAPGRRLIFTGDDRRPYEVVGVVGDEKVNGLDARTTPVVYHPMFQDPGLATGLVVRATGEPGRLAAALRAELRALEPDLSLWAMRTMDDVMASLPATFLRRYPALLIGVFAGVALLLATVGIYGVMSYAVSQQTREIGVRVALGARRRDILQMVVGRGMALALAGVGAGLVVSLAVTRLLGSLLYGVTATDPVTFAGVALLLAGVAFLACYLPARRATQIDPLLALRQE